MQIMAYQSGSWQMINIYSEKEAAPLKVEDNKTTVFRKPDFSNLFENTEDYVLPYTDAEKNSMYIKNDYGDCVKIDGKTPVRYNSTYKTQQVNSEAYDKQVELEKQYGVHGIVIKNFTEETAREEYGSLFYVNMDKFIYSAKAKADGLSDSKSNVLFNRVAFAEKVYRFFNKFDSYFGRNQPLEDGYYSENDYENINRLTAQIDNVFNELAENIANGKGDSIKALENKITVKGYDVTLAEILDIRDGFKAAIQMVNGSQNSFPIFTNNNYRYAAMGLGMSYLATYANKNLGNSAANLAKSTYSEFVNVQIENHEKWLSTSSVQRGTKATHPNAAFKGTYKEQIFNIFASIDTSSEKAFRNGINTALQKVIKLDYDIMIKRGAGHDFANGCAQTTKMFINEAISRMISFDKVSTIK